MTTEQKAKAYDEALKLARDYHEDKNCFEYLKGVLEHIFPELAESEDERIRKVLVELVKCNERSGYTLLNNVSTSSMLAWLEKQGEKLPAGFYYVNSEGKKFYSDTFKCGDIILHVKKQEEPQVYETKNGEVITYSESEGYKIIEPKFKIGDWVVINGFTILITDVRNDLYDTIFVNGEHRVYDTNVIDKDAHLWNILDVKDGDVLAGDSCIFIIQKLCNSITAVKTYCTLFDDGDFDDGSSILYFDISTTKPATKKQRDTLMKAIADAGYKWNADKKELKKIDKEIEL